MIAFVEQARPPPPTWISNHPTCRSLAGEFGLNISDYISEINKDLGLERLVKLIEKPFRIQIAESGDQFIKMATFHRVALGLEEGTTVYLAPVLPSGSNQTHISELILSTFHHREWRRMYRLQLKLTERDGVVAETLNIIKDHANISIMESLTTDAGRIHELLLFLSLTSKAKNALKKCILEDLKDSLIDNRIYFQKLVRLGDCAANQHSIDRHAAMCQIRDQHVVCPSALFQNMFKCDDRFIDGLTNRVIIFSDTEEKYAQIFFPRPEANLLRISVEHHETKGAIHSFAEAVSGHNANILSSYSRLECAGKSAQWKAIVEIPDGVKVSKIIQSIATSPGSKRFFEKYRNVELSYNRVEPHPIKRPGFIIGDSCPPELFRGRQEEKNSFIASVEKAIKKGESDNIIFGGFSKSGKSSLLDHLFSGLRNSVEFRDTAIAIKMTVHRDDLNVFWDKLIKAVSSYAPSSALGKSPHNTGYYGAPFKRDPSGDDYESFINLVKTTGKLVVVFLDEAHHITNADDDPGKLIFGKIALSKNAFLAGDRKTLHNRLLWVLANKESYKSSPGKGREIGLYPKFTTKSLKALSSDIDALSLIVEPFEEFGFPVGLLKEVCKKIVRVSRRHPVYIQAICAKICDEFQTMPENLDVFGSECLEEIFKNVAANDLHEHFKDIFDVLQPKCDKRVLRRMVHGESEDGNPPAFSKNRLITKDNRADFDLLSLPIIVSLNETRKVCFNELFIIWAKEKGQV